MPKISEHQVPLAAEDRFLIVSIQEAASLCPGAHDAAALGEAIEVAKPFLGDLTPLFDLRGLPQVYNDVDTFINEVASPGSHILVNLRTAQQIDVEYLATRRGLNVLSAKGHSYKARHFDMCDLRPDYSNKLMAFMHDPFFELSNSIVDHFAYERPSKGGKVGYDAPSVEEMRQFLTPKKLSALVRRYFPVRLWNGIKAAEFAQSIRIFFPKIAEALADLDEDFGKRPSPEATDFYLRSALLHAFLRKAPPQLALGRICDDHR